MISIALRSPLLTPIKWMRLTRAIIRTSLGENEVQYPDQEY